MKIFITGGAGFIGSHTADALIAAGHEVIVFDNFSTGRRNQVHAAAQIIEGDITERDVVHTAVLNSAPDAIVHCAAHISVREAEKDPAYDALVNVVGSLNVLEAAHLNAVQSVVLLGTGGVLYGDDAIRPTPETAEPKPEHAYSIHKLTVDEHAQRYRDHFGMSITTLRCANVYGPRQNPQSEAGVVSIFATQLLQGKQPVIYGTGQQTRDFVYVTDVAAAIIAAITHPEVDGVFHVSSAVETSIKEVYDTVTASLGGEMAHVKPVYERVRDHEQQHSALSFERAKNELGWEPQISFADGMKMTCDWFRAQ